MLSNLQVMYMLCLPAPELFSFIKEWSGIATFISAIVALGTFIRTNILASDKVYAEQAVLAVERVLNLLHQDIQSSYKIKSGFHHDKIVWLTSAKLIASLTQVKSYINTRAYKLVCNQQCEYFQSQLRSIIKKWYRHIYKGKHIEQSDDGIELETTSYLGTLDIRAIVIIMYFCLSYKMDSFEIIKIPDQASQTEISKMLNSFSDECAVVYNYCNSRLSSHTSA